MWMVTEERISEVRVAAESYSRLGGSFDVRVTVADGRGEAIDVVVPLEIKILNPAGKKMEFSGYYGAKDGVVEISYDAASNDEP